MDGDSSFWVEESSEQYFPPMKRSRRRHRKLEFIGWGSKPLIQFLQSIGRDTSRPFSRLAVEGIIDQYADDRKLIQRKKKNKKRIICDDLLSAIFGKKTVLRVHISKLLETHLAEFHNSSDDDSQPDSEEKDYSAKKVDKQASNNGSRPSCKKTKVSKNRSATICAKNLKLVYLKKSLVLDLLKAEESFADKVIGSFVRIKCDPNDYLQKNSHQLLQVAGVRMSSEADNDGKVYLQLSNRVDVISIEMLSDADFSEAECEDLHERVKAGLHKWPTFVEFEAKAGMLHKDIMKHWIPRQLQFLKNLIDRANEKGWRKELFELLDKRKMLENTSEQERLISETPEIDVETLDPQATPSVSIASDTGEKDTSSLIPYNWEACDNYYSDDAGSEDNKAPSAATTSNLVDEIKNPGITNGIASKEAVYGSGDFKFPSAATTSQLAVIEVKDSGIAANDGQSLNVIQTGNAGGVSGGDDMLRRIPIIELSDDDEPEEVMENHITIVDEPEEVVETRISIDDRIWCYKDPRGAVQGPFALRNLRRWWVENYFNPDFKVWRHGESCGQAVMLMDLLNQFGL